MTARTMRVVWTVPGAAAGPPWVVDSSEFSANRSASAWVVIENEGAAEYAA